MTKKLTARLSLITLAIVFAVVLAFAIAFAPAAATAKADAIPFSNGITSAQYGEVDSHGLLYALAYDETSGTTPVIDIANDFVGAPCTVSLYWYSESAPDHLGTMIDSLYFQDYGHMYYDDSETYTLEPDKYVYVIEWEAFGAYAASTDETKYVGVLTIGAKEVDVYLPSYDGSNFYVGEFSRLQTSFWYNAWVEDFLVYDMYDTVFANWYIMDGEEKVNLNTLDAGTYYDVYAEIWGPDAYKYDVTFHYQDDYSDGEYPQAASAAWKIVVAPCSLEVQVGIQGGAFLTSYQTGDTPAANDVYYNGASGYNWTATTNVAGIAASIIAWKDSEENTYDTTAITGKEYFLTTADFELSVTDELTKLSNYRLVNSNYWVRVSKRKIEYIFPTDFVGYTGSPVYPTFYFTYTMSGFDNGEESVVKAEMEVAAGDDIKIGTAIAGYDAQYNVALTLKDSDNYGFWYGDAFHAATEAHAYYITAGTPTVNVTNIEPWYYKDPQGDYTKKLGITFTTTEDPADAVSLVRYGYASLPMDGYTTWSKTYDDLSETWNDNLSYDLADFVRERQVGETIYIAVETTGSVSNNFNAHIEYIPVRIQKAPVYLRTTADLTFNNMAQKPANDTYRFYIYKADDADYIWTTIRADEFDGLIPLVQDAYSWTQANTDAGTYGLQGYIDNNFDNRYELVPYTAFDYELGEYVVVDADSTYTIQKKSVEIEDYTILGGTYGNAIDYSEPTIDVSQWIAGDSDRDAITVTYYYSEDDNLYRSPYSDEGWILIDENYKPAVGTHRIRYVATYKNYANVYAAANFVIAVRPVNFKWFESEAAYEAWRTGLEGAKDGVVAEDILTSHFTYTYNGASQYPYLVIGNLAYDDVIVPTMYYGRNDWSAADAVNVGLKIANVQNLNNDNYTMSGVNSACGYTIDKLAINATAKIDGTAQTAVVYDAQSHTLSFTINNVQSQGSTQDDVAISVSNATKTNASVYNSGLELVGAQAGNYSFDDSFEWEIEKNPITVTIANKNSIYGASIVDLTATVTSGTLYDVANTVYTLSTANAGGLYALTTTSPVGDYFIVGGSLSSNYEITFAGDYEYNATAGIAGRYSITPASITGYSLTQSKTLTYNGEAQTPTFDEAYTVVNTQTVTVKYSMNMDGPFVSAVPTFTDANEYVVWFEMSAPNHSPVIGSTNVTVETYVVEYTLKIDGEARVGNSVAYSGDSNYHVVTATINYVFGTEDVTIAVSGQYNEAATGTYNAILTLAGDDAANYAFANGTSTTTEQWGVGVAQITGVSVSQDGELIYNGDLQSATTIEAATTQNGAFKFWYSLSYNSGWQETVPAFAAANTYTVYYKVTSDSHADYGANADAKFTVTIKKKTLTITPNANLSKTYGSADPVIGYAVTENVQNETPVLSGALSRAAGEVVGNYAINLGTLALTNAAINSNYEIDETSLVATNFVINKKTLVVTWTASNPYNGQINNLPTPTSYNDSICDIDNDGILDDVAAEYSGGNLSRFGTWNNLSVALVGADKGNYELNADHIAYEITPVALDGVSVAQNAAQTYVGASQAPVVTESATRLNNDDVLTWTYCLTENGIYGELASILKKDANTYKVYYRVKGDGYNQASGSFDFVIVPAHVSITANNSSSIYGNANAGLSAEVTGTIYDGDSVYMLRTKNGEEVFTVDKTTHAGEYVIEVVVFDNLVNYVVDKTTNAIYTVQQREVECTIYNFSSTYGSEPNVVSVSYTGGSRLKDDVIVEVKAWEVLNEKEVSATTPVGTYDIVATAINDDYDVSFVYTDGKYTVNARDLTYTINDAHSYYGDDAAVLSAVLTAGEIKNDDTVLYTLTAYEKAPNAGNIQISATTVVAEDYVILGTDNDPNYNITFVNGVYRVFKRPVTVTYTSTYKQVTYGDEEGWNALGTEMQMNNLYFAAGNKGLVNGDTIFSIVNYTISDGKDNFSFNELGPETPAGKYLLIVTDAENANYDVTIEIDSDEVAYLLVNKATYDMSKIKFEDINVVYDATAHVATITGELPEGVTVAYQNNSRTNAGSQTATASFTGDYDNYNVIPDMTAGITITKATLTIEVGYEDLVYGTPVVDPQIVNELNGIGVTVTGWKGNENTDLIKATNVIIVYANYKENVMDLEDEDYFEDDAKPVNVGRYYVAYLVHDLENYEDAYDFIDFEIIKKDLTISVDNKDVVYGEELPAYTVQFDGFVYGEDVTALGGTLAFACDYKRYDRVGSYKIEASGYTSDNYAITYNDGTLTVALRPLTITIANKESVYGNAIEEFTWSVANGTIVNNDTVVAVTAAVTPASQIGTYPITGTKLNNNYDLTFQNGIYTVTVRTVTLTWGNSTFNFNGTAQKPEVNAGNLVNSDILEVTVAGEQTNAGNYVATATALNNPNYVLPEAVTQAFVINKIANTFDLTNVTKTFKWTGSAFSISGATALENAAISYENNSFKDVGSYVVTVKSAETANYIASSTTVNVTIEEAAPVKAADGTESYYKEINEEAAKTEGVNVTDLFANAKAGTAEKKEVKAEIGTTAIIFNAAAIEAIGAAENVTLKMNVVTENLPNGCPKGTEFVLEIKLDGATFADGKATVATSYEKKVGVGKTVKVYYIDENGKKKDMKATLKNGVLTFSTNHFSSYAVVQVLSAGTIAGIIIACVVFAAGVAFLVIFLLKKKGGNKGGDKKEDEDENFGEEEDDEAEEVTEAPAAEEKKE